MKLKNICITNCYTSNTLFFIKVAYDKKRVHLTVSEHMNA